MSEERFATEFKEDAKGTPGLVLHDDGTVWVVQPGGTEVEVGAGNGGSQPSITDAMVLIAPNKTIAGDGGVNYAVGDFTVGYTRGTDLSLVDTAGYASFHTVSGGDFGLSILITVIPTLDGGSAVQRLFATYTNNFTVGPLLTSLGIDLVTPIVSGVTVDDMAVAMPYLEIPADGTFAGAMGFYPLNGIAADSYVVHAKVQVYKLGPLPA